MPEAPTNTIAIIGGGLAGLAAAEAACRSGFCVELFEQADFLGGRAGSFVEPYNNILVDFSQHAAMGCCTNFLDFCQRTKVDGFFRRENTLHFLGPENQLHHFTPSRWLPAPFHLSAGLQNLKFLTAGDRKEIGRAIKNIAQENISTAGKENITFGNWLRGHDQSEKALEHFWSIFIQSALSETIDLVSFAAARKVFVDGFLSARAAGEMILPTIPLGEILNEHAAKVLSDKGLTIHRRSRVMWLENEENDENDELSLVLAEGDALRFDAVIVATAWHQAASLFPPMLLEEMPEIAASQKLCAGAIAAVHLWFDRPITPLPHAIFVDKLSQWVFAFSPNDGYYQVIISAAHRLPTMEKEAIRDQVIQDLSAAFPEAKTAELLHSRVVVQPQAVFTMQPGVEKFRPSQTTSIPHLFLAGDWTDTGWPATMEGAVRSGYLAVEALLKSLGRDEKILVDDLPCGFWARRIFA